MVGEQSLVVPLALTSPDSLWGGTLEYLEGRQGALEHGVARMPSIFMSKSIWHRPVRHHRPIHAVRRFERNFVNLLLVSGAGAMTFRSSTHTVVVEAGSFFCTKADRAYLCDLAPGPSQPLEILHLMVASHRMARGLHQDNALHAPILAVGSDWQAIRKSAELLFNLGPTMSADAAEALSGGLLAAISACAARDGDAHPSQTIMEGRRAEVLSFIAGQLENPNLCAQSIAAGCGISRRYLSLLLKQADTSLPEVLRSGRVALAQRIMTAPDKHALKLRDIAEMAGFRSYAQFHLAFRQHLGMPPGECRRPPYSASSRSRSNAKPS